MNVLSCSQASKAAESGDKKSPVIVITQNDTAGNSIRAAVLKDYCRGSMKYYIQSIHFPYKKVIDSLSKYNVVAISKNDVLTVEYQAYNDIVDSIVTIKSGHSVGLWLR